jgi:hypothetical protein
VREMNLSALKKGMQKVVWDGKNSKDQEVKAGEYSYRITATDEHEKPVQVSTGSTGIVNGVTFEQGKPYLLVGEKKYALDSIERIENAPVIPTAPAADKKLATEKSTKNNAASGPKSTAENMNLSSINNEKNMLQNDSEQEKINKDSMIAAALKQAMNTEPSADEEVSAAGNTVGAEEAQGENKMGIWNPYL